jgi:hypothetical protein
LLCTIITNVTSYFVIISETQGYDQVWSAYEIENFEKYDTLNVQVTLHETKWGIYPFVNNVGSAVTEIIWKFYVKFKHP